MQKEFALIILIIILASALFSSGCTGEGTDHTLVSIEGGEEMKKLTISGSTSIQPVSEILAAVYMNEHPGVDITVNGGGSSSGILEAGEGIVDIGSASREVKDSEFSAYPGMEVHPVGASAIVLITSQNNVIESITIEEIQALYNGDSEDISGMPDIAGIDTVVQRSEDSGTEETLAKWLFPGKRDLDSSLEARDTGVNGEVRQVLAEGNAEVLSLVKDNPHSIGFVDFGYAESDRGVKILKIEVKDGSTAVPEDISQIRQAILMELKKGMTGGGEGETYYVPELTRPLNYITSGDITALTEDFIDFACAPSSRAYFNEIGYFSITELEENQV
ncbi:MAG: substrate-binding domain-containing protein [Methanomicrobiaceae archaeon]|nr:substrate-binding domain-containing protein [Methanomicrobiaceae archaeon]